MLRSMFVAAAIPILAFSSPASGQDKPKPLREAIAEFNDRAWKNEVGKGQPMLTEDEVVAAIRGWMRDRHPVKDDVYKVYQTIADTKQLPAEAELTFTTRWSGFNGHEFEVWWVDLQVKTGPDTGYNYRLRDQKLRCWPAVK